MRPLAIVIVLALVGCQMSQQAEVENVADTFCHCIAPEDATCVDQLVQSLGTVSDACDQCVFENERTCASLIVDCIPLCSRQISTPKGNP
jgi:hypothetical protein